jgi:hypothetical protein
VIACSTGLRTVLTVFHRYRRPPASGHRETVETVSIAGERRTTRLKPGANEKPVRWDSEKIVALGFQPAVSQFFQPANAPNSKGTEGCRTSADWKSATQQAGGQRCVDFVNGPPALCLAQKTAHGFNHQL